MDLAARRVSLGLRIATWGGQIALAGGYLLFGTMKATQPLTQLAVIMKWVPEFPVWFVRGLGVVEVLGAIGLIMPALTGIRPNLTRITAQWILLHQFCAVALHVSKGEFSVLGLNAALIALALLVVWGRGKLTHKDPHATL